MKAAHPELRPGQCYLDCPCQSCRAANRRADALARTVQEENRLRNLAIVGQLRTERGRMP